MTDDDPKIAKTSMLAIASLVCSLLIMFFATHIVVSIVLGVMALVKIRLSNGALKGKWLAVGGIVISALQVLAIVLLFPKPPHKEMAQEFTCRANLKLIGLGLMMYADDNGGYLPTSLSNESIRKLVGSEKSFVCPCNAGASEEYTLLEGIAGRKLNEIDYPFRTPVIICNKHGKSDIVLYADMTTEKLPSAAANDSKNGNRVH